MEAWLEYSLYFILAYIIISIIGYFIQGIFLFHPEILTSDFIFHYDIPFKEVFIPVDDHITVNGLYFPCQEKTNLLVFYFKGNTRSIKGWGKFAKDFVPKGVDFFMIDYPGFGKSTGSKSQKSILKAASHSYEYLKKTFPDKEIIIYGRSLGSGFAAAAALEENPLLLILDSPYYSFLALVNYYAFFLPFRFFIRYKIPVNKYIPHMNCPVHLIHGTRDKVIPFAFSAKLAEENRRKVTLHSIERGKHNNLPSFPEYHTVLEDILKTLKSAKQLA